MLIEIISQYLETNKRLVIPQLGAFIVKTPGESVVFSELLKRDDGILRGLLLTEGLNELEAAGEIDRFVFEARHAVERGVGFPLPGFGILKPGPNSTITFDYDPTPVQPSEQAPAQPTRRPHPEVHLPDGFRTESPAEPGIAGQTHATDSVKEPRISPSAKRNPEPYVKGLRYGKPHKNTNTYTYVNGRRRLDRFMLIAIIAAVIAVGIIAYVFITTSKDEEPVVDRTEQTAQPAANTEVPAPAETPTSQTPTDQ